jgi:L-threonylcarbamoyladenylate synthase
MEVSLKKASSLLYSSQPVAIPTETVWGLAARLFDESAVRQIFFLKGRPLQNPLIIHLCDIKFLFACCSQEPPGLHDLIRAFWPGGLTVVVPVHENMVPSIVRSGLPTAAFRMPDHLDTLKLIADTGSLVAPSANRSGSPSATTPEHIAKDFGDWLPILKTKTYCRHGIESTILVWQDTSWHVGRLGAIGTDAIAKILGYKPPIHIADAHQPLCPGQLYRHYAPQAQLTLSSEKWKKELSSQYDGVLGFSDRQYPGAQRIVTVGESTNPRRVESLLYSALRDLDLYQLQSVFVDIDVPPSVDWLAIFDRLEKASRA